MRQNLPLFFCFARPFVSELLLSNPVLYKYSTVPVQKYSFHSLVL